MDYKQLIAGTVNFNGMNEAEIFELLSLPKDSAMGDFCLPCFKMAKELKKSPMAIAEEIAKSVPKMEFLSKIEAVGGYVNFTLNKMMVAKITLQKVCELDENYGASDEGAGKTICMDYSSINIAKPFHMGHLLNTTIGAAIYRMLGKLGYNVVGINHLGDWGTQFGKLIVAYKMWGDKRDIEVRGVRGLLDIYVRFHKEAKENCALDDLARDWFKKIEDGDNEALALWTWFKEITLKEVDKIYKRLNVTFDSYAGESFYNDKMTPVLDELKEKKLLIKSEGAQVVMFDEEENMPPCLLVRADGATLYATRDMAAAFYRKKTYNFYKCLYVVAYQQNLHFKQVFRVLDKMGCDWSKDMVHVAHGMVSLEDGALSTREGNVVFLEDVLNKSVEKATKIIQEKNPDLENKEITAEQVGVGAVVFGMLFNSRIKDTVFSYDKALNFEGETAPYIQYTCARCNSVLEKSGEGYIGESGMQIAFSDDIDYSGIDNGEASDLIRMIDRYPDAIKEAARKYEPSVVARHIIYIAQCYNKFYYEHNINNAEANVKKARLILTKATAITLKNGLALLGIATPNKM